MGKSILKGITTGLLVTVLTLLAVFLTAMLGFELNIVSYVLDFGLMLSCLSAGYKAARSSSMLFPAVLAAGSYTLIGVLLLALFFPINLSGAIRITGECMILGLLSGVLGAGILKKDPVVSQGMYGLFRDDEEKDVF